MYDLMIGHNLKPREGDNPAGAAEWNVRELLRDAQPEAFAIRTDSEGTDNSARAIKGMRELRPGEWEKLSIKEKSEWLIKVHQHVAEQYGFRPYTVGVQRLPANIGGYFNAGLRMIVLNESILNDASPTRALNAIAHETRHGFQWHAVMNPDKVPTDVRDKVQIWRDNFANYKNPAVHGYRAYYNQPVEVDARAFAEAIVKQALGISAGV